MGNSSLEQHSLTLLQGFKSDTKQTVPLFLPHWPRPHGPSHTVNQEGVLCTTVICPATATTISWASGKTKSKGSFFPVCFHGRPSGSLTVSSGWLPLPPGTLPLQHWRHNSQATQIVSQGTPRASGSLGDVVLRGIPGCLGKGPCWLGHCHITWVGHSQVAVYHGDEGGSRPTWETNPQVRVRIRFSGSQAGPQGQGWKSVCRLGSGSTGSMARRWHSWSSAGGQFSSSIAQAWAEDSGLNLNRGPRSLGKATEVCQCPQGSHNPSKMAVGVLLQ